MPGSKLNRLRAGYAAVAVLALAGVAALGVSTSVASAMPKVDDSAKTTTPIKHVVVLFDENISFDHYFGTYPNAANTDGTTFTAAAGTPVPNNYTSHPTLLTANPNQYQPARLTPAQAETCSQNHNDVPEQKAFNGGAMDKFVEFTQTTNCNADTSATGVPYAGAGLVMDYYDGNTVTGLWNYAQNYTMSDNSWGSVFGPSTPGALNLISGQTHGGLAVNPSTGAYQASTFAIQSPDATTHVGTVTNDPDPYYDDCSNSDQTKPAATNSTVQMTGKNIGDVLNDKGVTWGWFQGGFTPSTPSNGTSLAKCGGTTHTNIAGTSSVDYSPHHSPFQYYASTSNPHHLAPSSDAMIGHTDQANHNYDLTSFNTALAQNNVPAVSFLKAAEYQDGHAGYSDPIDEQHFLVNEINAIQSSKAWPSTAIVIAYDDSDGWYDHAAPTILNGSKDANVTAATPAVPDQALCQNGPAAAKGYADRCGPGPRLPMLLISPWTKQNNVDHTAIEQSSAINFIEDNWKTGRIGDASFDARAGSLNPLFNFSRPQQRAVLLNQDGSVKQIVPVKVSASVRNSEGVYKR